jgi:hypothetical protein
MQYPTMSCTKVEENSPWFPMVSYTASNDRRFRHYDFWTTIELLKLKLGAYCSVKGKLNSGAVQMVFLMRIGTQGTTPFRLGKPKEGSAMTRPTSQKILEDHGVLSKV